MNKTKHIYIFNWNQGGWNSELATNIRSARKQARERWDIDLRTFDGSRVLTIDYNSFRRVTMEEYNRILRTDGFW